MSFPGGYEAGKSAVTKPSFGRFQLRLSGVVQPEQTSSVKVTVAGIAGFTAV